MSRVLLAAAGSLLAACGSVSVPAERFYRLELPPAAPPDAPRTGVLRVHDLQLGTALSGDCLLVADGTRLEPRPLDRWIAPLDRLVTDALVLGLSRTRRFTLVKGGGDPGGEALSLHGRIVDFAEERAGDRREAVVALELWVLEGERVVCHGEFAARTPVAPGAGGTAAAAALSASLQQVLDQLVQRMGEGGMPAAPPAGRSAPPPSPQR